MISARHIWIVFPFLVAISTTVCYFRFTSKLMEEFLLASGVSQVEESAAAQEKLMKAKETEIQVQPDQANSEKDRTNEINAVEIAEEKVKKMKKMDCEGFPDWPLSPAFTLYDDSVGEPKCDPHNSVYPWVLHQTSAPNRRPSKEEVKATLSNLPSGTGYQWHSDKDICAFMRTQSLRFQALYNSLRRTPHKVDL